MLSAAGTLWPVPTSTRLAWRRPAGAGSRAASFAVVPSLRHPRFLVPRAPQAAVALRPAQGGLKGLRMHALAYLQRHSVLHRLPGQHLHVAPGPGGPGVEALLAAMTGDVENVVVRLGRPRPNRTLVVWAFAHDGRPVAIAKLSTGEVARRALETEYVVLAGAPAQGIAGLVAPEVLGYVRWHHSDVLVISPLVSESTRPSHEPPVAQMKALAASVEVRDERLRETAFSARLGAEIEALVSRTDRTWLRRGLQELLRDLGDTVVRTGAWHGDWVSWNMSSDGDSTSLWDWEHYATSVLAGFDHVHFLAQEQRGRGTDATSEDAWLARADVVLGRDWGLGADQRRAVLRAYLLEVNVRFVRDRQHDASSAVARDGWARQLLERLEGSAMP